MVVCEFSGEECNSTVKIELAGAVLNVSEKYAHLGKIINEKPQNLSSTRTYRRHEKISIRVIDEPTKILQQFMSKNNYSVKQIAHNSNIKEGAFQKMMSKKIPFDVKTAQTIEKSFNIKLTIESDFNQREDSTNIDDFIKNDENSNSNMEELMKDILNKIK